MQLYPPEWKEALLDIWAGLKDVSKGPIDMLRKSALFLLVIVVVSALLYAHARSTGRYQVVIERHILLVDTQTGRIWEAGVCRETRTGTCFYRVKVEGVD